MRLEIWIPGVPQAQPRARASRRGRFIHMYTPDKVEAGPRKGQPAGHVVWKEAIAAALREHVPAVPLDGPVFVGETLFFPRPKRLMRKSSPAGPMRITSKPDRDNLDKAVLDCLTNMHFWHNDAQASDGYIRRRYVPKGCEPGMWLLIATLPVCVENGDYSRCEQFLEWVAAQYGDSLAAGLAASIKAKRSESGALPGGALPDLSNEGLFSMLGQILKERSRPDIGALDSIEEVGFTT